MRDLSIKKLYYSISEVSKITDIEQYVLRYWETEFEQLSPQKNRAGNRIYTNKDIRLILYIKELLREKNVFQQDFVYSAPVILVCCADLKAYDEKRNKKYKRRKKRYHFWSLVEIASRISIFNSWGHSPYLKNAWRIGF